uniref:Potassium efflux system protein n=1 Tax=Candidatus Kentrum sp. FM TaxID=2126340 RepID=A0A450SVW3_9GAMM|nr:MAG: potassium efflux system protein [Candidatus Kentron sp. FM]VFJ58167.1 MAG: potassium efflux system protein [Candidatus Kentron sp. FM]VFK07199.1 MAG: potassium efflux system protein [Candidatus Kentron sp. FM]
MKKFSCSPFPFRFCRIEYRIGIDQTPANRNLFRFFPPLIAALYTLLAQPWAVAADTAQPTARSPDEVTMTRIDTGRKAVESDAGLDESQRKKALELYAQAEEWIQEAATIKAKYARLVAAVQNGPKRIKKLRARMDNPSPKENRELERLVSRANLNRLDAVIGETENALLQARETRKQQVEILSGLTVGAKDLSKEIDTRRKTMEQITANLDVPPTDEPTSLSQARTISLEASGTLKQEEIVLLKLRRDNHNLLVDLAQMERDFAEMEIARYQAELQVLQESAHDLREKQATQAREEAERSTIETTALPDSLRAIANETTEYRIELEDLARKEKTLSEALAAAKVRLDGIKSDFERIRQRVAMVGPSQAIGNILRTRRAHLPSMSSYRRASRERKVEINRAIDRQLHVDERLHGHGTIGELVTQSLTELPPEVSRPEKDRFEKKAVQLIQARRDALNELQKVYGNYIGNLGALDLAERQLVSVAQSYVDYIGDELLWIPDPSIWDLYIPQALFQASLWLSSPDNWSELAGEAIALAHRYPVPAILLATLFIVLLGKRRWAKKKLGILSQDAWKIRDYAFAYFLVALGLTLVITGWPVSIACAGYLVTLSTDHASFTNTIAQGIFRAGMLLAGGLFLLHINGPDGMGDRYLRWSAPVREALRREFRWITPTAVVLSFLITITTRDSLPPTVWPLGRVAFVLLMMGLLVFVYRLLRARGQLMKTWGERSSTRMSLLTQLHFLWFPLLLLAPLCLALLSILGYRTLSMHFLYGVEMTLWFFIGLFLSKEFVLRYLTMAERRLRYEEAIKKREELRAQRALEEEENKGQEDTAALPPLVEIPHPDFEELGDQAKRLVHAGFLFCAVIGTWFIWSDLLFALGLFGDAGLSLYGEQTLDGVAGEMPVTLGDVIKAMILLLITGLAARNIPGVLEITLLQRLPLETGGRYAFTTLTQYAIVGAGVFTAFSTLGVQWSNIQWLVAALSVGLGFGLQEIVANFISGIILLFERPIRVGDVVTIDKDSGIVSRIRIRATTIVNWEKQELLIPNKDLVTGRLTNWTLTDKLNRIVITVGIAYGSDVALALRLLEQVGEENPNVLTDPPPFSTFERFGDNALTLLLRCYIYSVDNRLGTLSALHQGINDKFNAAGISIAFPQRDIHLDTLKPLDIHIHR